MTISTPEAPAPPLVPLVARRSPVSIGGMLLLAVLWGLSIPITKLGLDSPPPIAITGLRFSVAAHCLFLFALGRHWLPLSALPKVPGIGGRGLVIGPASCGGREGQTVWRR